MSSGIEGVYDFLKSNGYNITHDLVLDDKPHDYKKDSYKFWYIGTISQEGITFTFEDYTKNNGRRHYRSNRHVMYSASHLTKELRSAGEEVEAETSGLTFQKSIEEKKLQQDQEKKEANILASLEAKIILDKCRAFEQVKIISPYLIKKGFDSVGTGAQFIDENGKIELIIPIQNIDGDIVNVQRILADGKKLFLKGGQKKECFHVICEKKSQEDKSNENENENENPKSVYLTEGYATGLSIHLATNCQVVVCFDAGNLKAVSKIISKKFGKECTYYIAADDDHLNEVNTGVQSAEEALKNIHSLGLSAYLCIPDFGGERKESDTDWNDLHLVRGLEEVKLQLKSVKNKQHEDMEIKQKEFVYKPSEVALHPRINIQAPDSYYELWERAQLSLGKGKAPLCNYENVVKVFNAYEPLQKLVWYDEFHQKYLTVCSVTNIPREWRDNDDLALTLFFQQHIGLKTVTNNTIASSVTIFADKNIRNEPKDWMNSLEWDGVNRCEEFFVNATGAQNTNYVRSIGKNWWTALVARIFKPGCKVDNMLILEGPQGAYKSELLKVIAGPWFGEGSESLVNKDFYENLKGKLIYEIGELDQFNKAETTTIKRVITCQVDRYRKAYGRRAEDNPRTCVFVGTTNEDEYLKDSTGGRRFWPILIEKIDLEYVRRSRSQLFAEAVVRFKRGENWWEMPETETKEQQEERRIRDGLEEVLMKKLRTVKEATLDEISEIVLGVNSASLKMPDQFRLGRALRALGWKKQKAWRNGVQIKVWKNFQTQVS